MMFTIPSCICLIHPTSEHRDLPTAAASDASYLPPGKGSGRRRPHRAARQNAPHDDVSVDAKLDHQANAAGHGSKIGIK